MFQLCTLPAGNLCLAAAGSSLDYESISHAISSRSGRAIALTTRSLRLPASLEPVHKTHSNGSRLSVRSTDREGLPTAVHARFAKNQRPHFPFSYVSSFVVKGLNILNAADARHGANLGPRIGNAPRRRRAGAARAGRYNNDLQSSRAHRTHSHRR